MRHSSGGSFSHVKQRDLGLDVFMIIYEVDAIFIEVG